MIVDMAALLHPACIATGVQISDRRRVRRVLPGWLGRQSNEADKRRVLSILASLLAKGDPSLDATEILIGLLARESLGGTAVGEGVAFPHCRLKTGQRVVGAFLKLSQGVDFDACDHQAVDLLFAFATPAQGGNENVHLGILARLAYMFSDPTLRRHLRDAEGEGAIYEVFTTWTAPD